MTEAAMNAGTQGDPIVVTTWSDLKDKLSDNAPDGENKDNPTHYRLGSNIQPGESDYSIMVASDRHVVLDLNGNTIDRGLTSATSSGYVIRVNGNLTITGGYDAKYCNAKSVKLNKSAVTLKVGKTTTVKATVKGVKSGKKLLTHVRKVRYYSSNINVATVNKSGKIKATGTGKCTIWAIANNGVRTSVKVTVK